MLNKDLYNRLQSAFGSVKIAKENQAIKYTVIDIAGTHQLRVIDFGETYRVCCPFCRRVDHPDMRHRLWISHMWGVPLKDFNGKRLWNLAKCFHNDCLSQPDCKSLFIEMVIGKWRSFYSPKVGQGKFTAKDVPELPGHCEDITSLPQTHHAVQYIIQRGFDPCVIGPRYGVKYCVDSEDYPMAIDRLVIPITLDGKVRGWQCRYIGTPRSKYIPKYYTAPGMSIKRYLYDFDAARHKEEMVLVEGVIDAWAVGDGGVAIFGKTLSTQQRSLIAQSACSKIVVFLDPDARENAFDICKSLASMADKKVYVVKDAQDDPGSLGTQRCWEYIRLAAAD